MPATPQRDSSAGGQNDVPAHRMCGRVRRPNRRQIDLICTQPSGEITNGAAAQNGGYSLVTGTNGDHLG